MIVPARSLPQHMDKFIHSTFIVTIVSATSWTRQLIVVSLANSKVPWPWSSPIGDRMRMEDVCWYAPGDVNKLGKETKTSWDTFSYFLMMAHNVYQHIESIQRANSLTDTACHLNKPDPGLWRKVKGQADQMSELGSP